MSDLIVETEGAIARLTMNRPDVHNAFNADIVTGIRNAIDLINGLDHVRVITLAGAGPSFSAGGDLNQMRAAKDLTREENRDDAMALSGMLDSLFRSEKPVIAVAHGAVMGGGVGLIACADIVIASADTKFALSEVKLGLTPATISPYVVRAIGLRWARRLFTTAERFDARLAEKINLIHEVVADQNSALSRATELAALIRKNGPIAVREAKKLAMDVADNTITDSLRADTADRIADRRISDEGQEGLTAFLEKRKPGWIET